MSTKRIGDEIREKVLAAVRGGHSIREAAAQSGVSVGSATRWAKAAGVKGRPAPKRHGDDKREAALQAVREGLTLLEVSERFEAPIARIRVWMKSAGLPN